MWLRLRKGLPVSAHTGAGLIELKSLLLEKIVIEFHEDAPAASNARHFETLKMLKTALETAAVHLRELGSPDLVALELQMGLQEIHEMLGIVFDDQVMDRVFSEFCIGK